MKLSCKYWMPLFNQFISKANTIRIGCYNNEASVIEYVKNVGKKIINIDTEDNANMTLFMIDLTEESIKYLLKNCFSDNNLLKYFNFSLWHNNVELVSSEHYGNECTICNIDYDEINKYRSFIPKSSSIIVHDEEGIVFKTNC
jgi:hypothetical protein